MGNLIVASFFCLPSYMTHLGAILGQRWFKGQKLPFSLQMTIKSWHYLQVSYLRQETWWWYLFSVYQSIWSILGAFPGSKKGKKCQKLPIHLKMTFKCWNCLQVSYFRQETLYWYPFLTPVAYLEPSQTSTMKIFRQNSKKLHCRYLTLF